MSRPYLSVKDTPCSQFAFLRCFSQVQSRAKGVQRKAHSVSIVLEEKYRRDTRRLAAARRSLSKHGRHGRFPPHPRPRFRGIPPPRHGYTVRPRRSETLLIIDAAPQRERAKSAIRSGPGRSEPVPTRWQGSPSSPSPRRRVDYCIPGEALPNVEFELPYSHFRQNGSAGRWCR